MTTEDPYHLRRFAAAQDGGGTYDRAVAELRAGRKTSHWMWFIFPQIAGLGLGRYFGGQPDSATEDRI